MNFVRSRSGEPAKPGDIAQFDYVLRRANGYFIYGAPSLNALSAASPLCRAPAFHGRQQHNKPKRPHRERAGREPSAAQPYTPRASQPRVLTAEGTTMGPGL